MDATPQARRLEVIRRTMIDQGLDALLISQPENRSYLSGFKAGDAALIESSGHLFITRHQALLMTDFRYTEEAAEEAPDYEIKTYTKGLAILLAEEIELTGANGLGRIERLGFEAEWLTHAVVSDLSEKLAPVSLVPTRQLVSGMRIIKDGAEVAAMDRSLACIEEVLDGMIAALEPGMTELEAAWLIYEGLHKHGAEPAFETIVASGPNGAKPHAVPGNKKLAEGEPIVIDVGAKLDGYCSDITRTVCIGEPPQGEFREVYATVRKAQLHALANIEPHMDSVTADAFARDIISQAGYGPQFGHSLGHGVGLATHEAPSVSPLRSTELKPGMIFTVEPGIYLPGRFGIRLEVMAEMTGDGVRQMGGLDRFYSF